MKEIGLTTLSGHTPPLRYSRPDRIVRITFRGLVDRGSALTDADLIESAPTRRAGGRRIFGDHLRRSGAPPSSRGNDRPLVNRPRRRSDADAHGVSPSARSVGAQIATGHRRRRRRARGELESASNGGEEPHETPSFRSSRRDTDNHQLSQGRRGSGLGEKAHPTPYPRPPPPPPRGASGDHAGGPLTSASAWSSPSSSILEFSECVENRTNVGCPVSAQHASGVCS